MKKIITSVSLFLFSVANAAGHLSEKDKKTTLNGIKIRGVFDTLEQASEHAKKLQTVDKYFNVFVGEVGKWLPYDPAPLSEQAGNPEYAQDQLNNLMKGYLENQNKAKIFEEKRKVEQVRKGVQDAIEGNIQNKKEIEQKILESKNENDSKSLTDKVKSIEKQIKELEERSNELSKEESALESKLSKLSVNEKQQQANNVTV